MRRVPHTGLEPWPPICRLDIPREPVWCLLSICRLGQSLKRWLILYNQPQPQRQEEPLCPIQVHEGPLTNRDSFRPVALRLSGIQSLWNQASPDASSTKPNRFRAWTGHHGNLECQEEEHGVQTFAHLPETLVLGFSYLKMELEFFPPDWGTMCPQDSHVVQQLPFTRSTSMYGE